MPDWDERYRRGEHAGAGPDPLLGRALSHFDADAGPRATRRALDLACGAGRHALLLAERGFEVTAVDSSRVAVGLLRETARGRGLEVDARVADLERGGFEVEPAAYDLVCDFYYLQRDLFPAIRAGVRPGGLFVAAIHTVDEDPLLKPMNPAFLLRPGELRGEFSAWEILLYEETKDSEGERNRRRAARLIARRTL